MQLATCAQRSLRNSSCCGARPHELLPPAAPFACAALLEAAEPAARCTAHRSWPAAPQPAGCGPRRPQPGQHSRPGGSGRDDSADGSGCVQRGSARSRSGSSLAFPPTTRPAHLQRQPLDACGARLPARLAQRPEDGGARRPRAPQQAVVQAGQLGGARGGGGPGRVAGGVGRLELVLRAAAAVALSSRRRVHVEISGCLDASSKPGANAPRHPSALTRPRAAAPGAGG